MNNEIKEILDFKKEDADYKRLSVDEITILKDYITNLQDNNEYLNKCNIELARRNTKAIEYIKSNEFIGRIRLNSENKQSINKLLDILKGSDKE